VPAQRTEALNFHLQASTPFAADSPDAADQVPGVVPAFDGDDAAAGGEGEIRRGDGEGIVARLEKHGLAAEAINRSIDARADRGRAWRGRVAREVVARGVKSLMIWSR